MSQPEPADDRWTDLPTSDRQGGAPSESARSATTSADDTATPSGGNGSSGSPRRTSPPSSACSAACCCPRTPSPTSSRCSAARDFYRPAHEPIYDAILDLYGRGEPADADHRLRRADQARRARPGRRRALPAHPDRRRCRPRPTPATTPRSSASGPSCAGWSRPAPGSSQMGYAADGATSTTIVDRAQAEVYAVTERRTARGLPAARPTSWRAPSTRSRRSAHRGGADGRRPHRLRRPRRADQRPAPRPDDRRRGPPRDRQVHPGTGLRPVVLDQATG